MVVESEKGTRDGVSFGEEAIFGSAKEDVMGVAVNLNKATDSSVLRRVKESQASLRALIKANVLVKGMDSKKAIEVRETFIESRCEYGCLYGPISREVENAIDVVDARFIKTTTCLVGADDKRKLEKLRALLSIESSRMLRLISAHQIKSRTTQTEREDFLSGTTREGERSTSPDKIPGMRGLGERADQREVRKRENKSSKEERERRG